MADVQTLNGDRIVVEPWDGNSAYRLQNLVRIDPSGMMVWRATLPENTGPDSFVSVCWSDGALLAYTASGYIVELDPENGRHLGMVFGK